MGISSELSELKFGDVLKKAGMTMLTKVGGASGPLYGSLLLGMSKSAPEEEIDFLNDGKVATHLTEHGRRLPTRVGLVLPLRLPC